VVDSNCLCSDSTADLDCFDRIGAESCGCDCGSGTVDIWGRLRTSGGAANGNGNGLGGSDAFWALFQGGAIPSPLTLAIVGVCEDEEDENESRV